MKRLFYLILENNSKATSTFEQIKSHGFNGTIVSTESLKHAVDEYFPEDDHFFNLRSYENRKQVAAGFMAMFVVDEERINELKQIVRDYTNNFKEINGGMFSKKIDDFEGSF